jgi:tight adherence protein C
MYIFFDDKEDNTIQRRLQEFAIKKHVQGDQASPQKANEMIKNVIKLLDPITSAVYKKIDPKSARQLLLEAGLPTEDEAVYKFIAQKVLFAAFGGTLAFLLAISGNMNPVVKMLLFAVVPLTCYRLPDMKLRRIAKIKNVEITYNLPDALDLLTVCVEAGLGLDAAFVRVSQELGRTCPIMAQELGRVSKDIMSGMSRAEAFRNLSNRNTVSDLKSFVALLIQTDKLGTSIAQSLRVYSDTMRTKRKQRAEKLAAQASIKMVIPLVLFVLPSMFVVLLTPAAITLFENFKTLNY